MFLRRIQENFFLDEKDQLFVKNFVFNNAITLQNLVAVLHYYFILEILFFS